MHTASNTIGWFVACAAVMAGGALSCRSAVRPSSRPADASVESAAALVGGADPIPDVAAFPGRAIAYSPSPWLEGSVSRLRSGLVEAPQHDGSFGKTRFELEATDGSDRPPWRRDLEGQWTVLGYSPVRHAYVLGGQFEKGAWLPLDDLRYLKERTGSLLPSRLSGREWIALAAIPSPTLRYVALIARVDGQPQFRLHVLDLEKDEIAEVGPAPAPPPTDFKCDPPPQPHQWGDEVDGLVEMDAGIIVFSADERRLTASYGDDTCAARSAQRTTREWNLECDIPWSASASVAADAAEAVVASDLPGPIEEIATLPEWNQGSRVRSADVWTSFAGLDRVLVVWTSPITAVPDETAEPSGKRLASGRIEARWLDGAAHPLEAAQTLVERNGLGLTWAGFATEPEGGFVVSWSDADWQDIRPTSPMTLTALFQRFGPDLAPRGPIVQADAEPFGSVPLNIWPLDGRAVAVAAEGKTLIVWQRRLGYSDSQLVARAFDGAGAPLVDAEAVTGPDAAREGRQEDCELVRGPDGGFVGWVDAPWTGYEGNIRARRFDAGLEFRGDAIEIADVGRSVRMASRPDGSWVALWIASTDRGDRLFAEHLFVRSFGPDGQPRGEAVRISGQSFRDVVAPILPESADVPLHFLQIDIAAEPDGGFVAAWTPRVLGKGGPRDRGVWYPGVFAQRFADDGTPIGSPVVVDSSRREWTGHGGELAAIRAAVGPDGRILIVWADVDEDHTDTLRIRARMLPADLTGGPPAAEAAPSAAGAGGAEATP
ncbi:MAG: hypothetical protein HY905_18930 [Deltaproteobacteria bacterium]|nr:hypothetical protein [Deltaproteobacteria bacterium]